MYKYGNYNFCLNMDSVTLKAKLKTLAEMSEFKKKNTHIPHLLIRKVFSIFFHESNDAILSH